MAWEGRKLTEHQMPVPAMHGYNVNPVMQGKVMLYRATCSCGEPFPLRNERTDAGLDGLDHVRAIEGRPLRRDEIELETAAKIEAARSKRSITRGR